MNLPDGTGDLSEFMKTFKQRVSQWYNSNYSHEGTLWGGRFKSVLVEDGRYLRNLVAYIHGNPIRAGLVTRAADYEWSASIDVYFLFGAMRSRIIAIAPSPEMLQAVPMESVAT